MDDDNKLKLSPSAVSAMTISLRTLATAGTAMELCADLIADHVHGTEDRAARELRDDSFYGIEAVIRLATHAISQETEKLENMTGFTRFHSTSAFKELGEGA